MEQYPRFLIDNQAAAIKEAIDTFLTFYNSLAREAINAQISGVYKIIPKHHLLQEIGILAQKARCCELASVAPLKGFKLQVSVMIRCQCPGEVQSKILAYLQR